MPELPRLYRDLAPWYHLLTAPEDYAEEAEFYRGWMEHACEGPVERVLELGCGGGNNASHLKQWFDVTLTDVSPAMLAVSRGINPECEHVEGDMRSLRLGRMFDAVFVHDAVMYLLEEADLRAAMDTAFAHCRPGGAAIFAPDCVLETFRSETDTGGHDGHDGRGLRYLEWTRDPDPADSRFTVDMAYLLRHADGTMECVYDRHEFGLFSRDTWLRLLIEAGFDPTVTPLVHSEVEPGVAEVFIARRPSATRASRLDTGE